MDASPVQIFHDLVMIGGGHSHAIALRMWAMDPIPGVRLTLISDVVQTPYSGMLPGYVAGTYTHDQCHIDLQTLSQYANARLIADRATGLDLEQNRVLCAHHPPIAFDTLSIDIGSTPAANRVPGAADYSIPVKPIAKFLTQWDVFVQQVQQQRQSEIRIGIVGGGAGGVELALSAQAHLQALYRQVGESPKLVQVHLFQRGAELMPERHPTMRHKMRHVMERRGIHLHLEETVTAIHLKASPDAGEDPDTVPRRVVCESGLEVVCDRVFWVTQAAAASWVKDSALDTDAKGFIQVGETLQSLSHPQVFAAGDIATMVKSPRPKAGVFAVRQGKPLFENLRRAILQQPLQSFQPQKQFLILVGTGQKTAVASRGRFTFGPSKLLWNWKDWIDQKFMDQFTQLTPAMAVPTRPAAKSPDVPTMYCAGCASKVGSSVLEQALTRLRAEHPNAFHRDDVVVGLASPDDAAAIAIRQPTTLIQTVDYFRAIVADPFIAGQIAAHHCLSDLFAMGATPHSVMAIASLPYGTQPKQEETLYHLLSGALKVLNPAHAVLVGGHTVEGADLALGFACTGFSPAEHLLRKGGMQPGDALILTKPLGIGMLFAAHMQLRAHGRWIQGAIASMIQSNQAAAQILQAHQARACTDVTGFGLLGHSLEMVRSSHVGLELYLEQIPSLDGVPEILEQGIVSSLQAQNLQALSAIRESDRWATHPRLPILFDPQTSGGLLASVPGAIAESCLQALHQAGYDQSAIVGQVTPLTEGLPPVVVV